ncbi:hypothetical protein [Cyclobacterium jeungdonense]|uniref:DUF4856 domain-containing protein n=1 Tax=Cyclobacterium jeungdonense TaxID=708087 RepID=A0ABT8C6X0_9BACT|nr:hypothetical protein [Cyclobacterium jeungdonense]MDN3688504.1 hypothetical protein [Cyclobacterium jeungdonense]
MKRLFDNRYLTLIALFVLGLAFFSCDNEEDPTPPELQIPTAYDGTDFSSATATEAAVLTQLSALAAEAQRGRQGQTVSLETLESLYAAGNPSVEDISTTYYAQRLTGTGGWLDELAKASGGSVYTPGEPQGQGGTLGGYLFDENGLEMEQIAEKGLFGAALYNHATTLLSGQMTSENVDQVLAVFGATPAFSNSGSSNVASGERDRFMANYAARRDKNDGNGLYSQMKAAFLKLQAATKAGQEYQEGKEEAISEVKLLWEKANAATIINYCHATISRLSATNPSSEDMGAALHAYSEAVGFLHGWRTISEVDKRISDAQIDQLLVLFNAPQDGVPTSYKFATDPVNELPKLTLVIEQLKSLYEFSTQDIEDFKKNWVSEQGR